MVIKSTFENAVRAAKAGNKYRARQLLRELIKSDPKNENAWLLFAEVAQKRNDSIKCLKQVININPNNDIAREKLLKYPLSRSPSFSGFVKKAKPMSLVTQGEQDQRNRIALGLLAFALVIIICVMVALLCNPRVLFSSPPQYTPEPTLTPKEEMEQDAYFACAKYSYEPYYYPFAYMPFGVENWSPITYPLPKSAVTGLGDNWYKVDLHVKYTIAHVEQSPISGKDVVIRNDYQDIWECNAHYRGTEDGIEYWDIEILGRKK